MSSFAVLKNTIMISTVYKIAVTGSAGSGKSLVCRRFSELGLFVVSSDKIARQVVEPGKPAYEKLVKLVGRVYLLEDGNLNRAMLRSLISRNAEMRKKLEAIVQPEIVKELFSRMVSAGEKGERIVVAEVPLLFELRLDYGFDLIITVAAENRVMKNRIAVRDKITVEEAGKFLNLQMPQQTKIENSDKIIWNNGTIEDLFTQVDKIYSLINDSFIDRKINLS